MKQLKFLTFALLVAFLPLIGCDDDDELIEEVPLSEIQIDLGTMTFDADGAGTQRVTVVAEEAWVATYPDWAYANPSRGDAGRTAVSVTVSSNYTDEEPNAPRSGKVVFTGLETGTSATAIIQQGGMETYSLADLASINDGAVIYVPEILVVDEFTEGYIMTDGITRVWVECSGNLNTGDEIYVVAEKTTEYGIPALVVESYEVLSSGNEIENEPTDVTDVIDSYEFALFELVTIDGTTIDDGVLTIEGADSRVALSDIRKEGQDPVDPNHYATYTGYYVGKSSSTVELFASEVVDGGKCWTTVANLDILGDGIQVYVTDLFVLDEFPNGYMMADNTGNVWATYSSTLTVGDEISVDAVKQTVDSQTSIAINTYERISSGNNVKNEPTDITNAIDSYEFSQWEYITVDGYIDLDGYLVFEDMNAKVAIANMEEGVETAATMHLATYTGYYAGKSGSVVNLYVTDVVDNGQHTATASREVTLFYEDWEWLFDYGISSTMDVVPGGTSGSTRLDSSGYTKDGVSALTYMINTLGYNFVQKNMSTYATSTNVSSTRLYFGGGYLRWGATGYEVHMYLPLLDVPEDSYEIKSVEMTFDWANRFNEGVLRHTIIVVYLMNDGEDYILYEFPYYPSDTQQTWHSESIDLTDLALEGKFTKNTRIGIGGAYFGATAETADQYADMLLYGDPVYFLDNIKIVWNDTIEVE